MMLYTQINESKLGSARKSLRVQLLGSIKKPPFNRGLSVLSWDKRQTLRRLPLRIVESLNHLRIPRRSAPGNALSSARHSAPHRDILSHACLMEEDIQSVKFLHRQRHQNFEVFAHKRSLSRILVSGQNLTQCRCFLTPMTGVIWSTP